MKDATKGNLMVFVIASEVPAITVLVFTPHTMKITLRSGLHSRVAILLLASSITCSIANAASSLVALGTFGTNGWLPANSNAYLTTDNSQRGMGWNPVTKNLVIPSRSGGNYVAIIDGRTGAVIKTLNTTGVTGGTLAMQQAGVSDDGAIFVTNLQSGSSALSPFKIYKWNSESDTNAPSLAFSQVNPTTTTGAYRFGDAFDVYGSGTSMVFAAAGSGSSGTSGGLANNSNFMIGRLDGSNTNTIYRAIPNTLTASNDYRLSLAFVDANTIFGNQGTSAKLTDFSVTSDSMTSTGATIAGTVALGAAERGLDYTVINGTAVLATINTSNSQIIVYDVTDLNNIRLLHTLTTTTGTLTVNANASSSVKWGEMLSPTSQILYGMSTNQGIQAMVFTLAVPEPTNQQQWRFTNFGSYDSLGSAADSADPDGDGLSNLMEYALGTGPNSSGVIPAVLALNGANLEYTYTRSTAAKDNGLTYQIEWSETLEAGSWSSETVTQQITSTQGTVETVKASVPKGSTGKRFLRLKVQAVSGN